MRKTLIFLSALIVIIAGGAYCIKNGNDKQVVQALQNYNENPNGQQVTKKIVKHAKNTNDKKILDDIEGIWGNGIIYSYMNDSKHTDEVLNKYSMLAKKNVIISDHRYFSGFDKFSYNKEFRDPYYKINKVNEENINKNLKGTHIIKENFNESYMSGQYYKITIIEENKDSVEQNSCPIFYTNGKVLIINYKGCFFRYTKLN